MKNVLFAAVIKIRLFLHRYIGDTSQQVMLAAWILL